VPTVNGRLSFRHVGESNNPRRAVSANATTDQERIIIAYQFRPLSDTLFQPLLHILFQLEGSFYFALSTISIGVPGDTDELRGKIYVYKSKEDWAAQGKQSIRPRILAIRDLALALDADRYVKMRVLYQQSEEDLERTADIFVDFVLYRSGEVFFAEPVWKDEEIEAMSDEYAASLGHDLSKWIADQSYFFLRDITHRHQHHRPSSDTILVLQYRGKDDVGWRRFIVYSLYHHIIRAKRFGDTASLFQSMGVLAYCQSFQTVCRERHPQGIPGLPSFSDDTLLLSLRARAEESIAEANERTADENVRISWRLFSVALIGVIAAFIVMFVQPEIEKGAIPRLKVISGFIAENLVPILALIVTALAIVIGLTRNKWQIDSRVGRDILELSNVRRATFAAVFLGLGVVIVGVTLFIAYPAFNEIVNTLFAFIVLVFSQLSK
jgi:hypothetical protein